MLIGSTLSLLLYLTICPSHYLLLAAELLYPSGLFRKPLRFAAKRAIVNSPSWRPGGYLVLDTGGRLIYHFIILPVAECALRIAGRAPQGQSAGALSLPRPPRLPLCYRMQRAACCAWSPRAPQTTPAGCWRSTPPSWPAGRCLAAQAAAAARRAGRRRRLGRPGCRLWAPCAGPPPSCLAELAGRLYCVSCMSSGPACLQPCVNVLFAPCTLVLLHTLNSVQ